MPSRWTRSRSSAAGEEPPWHNTRIGISRRDPDLRRRPDRQDPGAAALRALPQRPRLAPVLAPTARPAQARGGPTALAPSPKRASTPLRHSACLSSQASVFRSSSETLARRTLRYETILARGVVALARERPDVHVNHLRPGPHARHGAVPAVPGCPAPVDDPARAGPGRGPAVRLDTAGLRPCLLYTSPSPRDRS